MFSKSLLQLWKVWDNVWGKTNSTSDFHYKWNHLFFLFVKTLTHTSALPFILDDRFKIRMAEIEFSAGINTEIVLASSKITKRNLSRKLSNHIEKRVQSYKLQSIFILNILVLQNKYTFLRGQIRIIWEQIKQIWPNRKYWKKQGSAMVRPCESTIAWLR